MTDWLSLAAAIVAGLLGLAGVILNTRTARRAAAADLLQRYQEPLVRAAYELQSRLWNILEKGILTAYAPGTGHDEEWQYARTSTAWLFGQYFAWVEILRQETQFLPLRSQRARVAMERALAEVAHCCSSENPALGGPFQMFRSQQRAMGEVMTRQSRDASGQPRAGCRGYADFCAALERQGDPVARWFGPLLRSVDDWVADPHPGDRLRRLQNALIDLVDLIDRTRERFPDDRTKVTR